MKSYIAVSINEMEMHLTGMLVKSNGCIFMSIILYAKSILYEIVPMMW